MRARDAETLENTGRYKWGAKHCIYPSSRISAYTANGKERRIRTEITHTSV